MKYVLGALVLVLVLLQMRLWSGAGSLQDISRLELGIKAQEMDNAMLQERNGILRKEVNDLKTGQDAIEERARSELGLIKKGETYYLVVEPQSEQKQEQGDSRSSALLIEPASSLPLPLPDQQLPATTSANLP